MESVDRQFRRHPHLPSRIHPSVIPRSPRASRSPTTPPPGEIRRAFPPRFRFSDQIAENDFQFIRIEEEEEEETTSGPGEREREKTAQSGNSCTTEDKTRERERERGNRSQNVITPEHAGEGDGSGGGRDAEQLRHFLLRDRQRRRLPSVLPASNVDGWTDRQTCRRAFMADGYSLICPPFRSL